MTKKVKNQSFNSAKSSKQDEFYTQLSDIESELKHYKKHVLKEITEGSKVEVIKGKKYPIGLQGTVKKLYTYIVPNTYNKVKVQYAILDTGEKISVKNIKLIEC